MYPSSFCSSSIDSPLYKHLSIFCHRTPFEYLCSHLSGTALANEPRQIQYPVSRSLRGHSFRSVHYFVFAQEIQQYRTTCLSIHTPSSLDPRTAGIHSFTSGSGSSLLDCISSWKASLHEPSSAHPISSVSALRCIDPSGDSIDRILLRRIRTLCTHFTPVHPFPRRDDVLRQCPT